MVSIEYYVGQKLRFRFSFRTADRIYSDPTAIRFRYVPPCAEEIVITAPAAPWAHDDVGVWHLDLTLDTPGTWQWRLESDGVETADQGKFRVLKENM